MKGSEEHPHRHRQEPRESVWIDVLDRLGKHASPTGRYKVLDHIAQGGMGKVLRVWDESLRRHLAMKVMLDPPEHSSEMSRAIGRFLGEAQVTGQLDHPGIVPVHDLGLDGDGRLYYTMKQVRGEELGSVFLKVQDAEDGWNQTRALSALQRVCEAMAFAHSRGVVHRDLKPANIMVGAFGEVYVMDWGLAHVLHDEAVSERWATELDGAIVPSSDKTEIADQRPDSQVVTLEGDVLGSPPFMAPEQARGELDRIRPQTDVYSMGAILYQLLTGRVPFVEPGRSWSAEEIRRRVLDGPPAPVTLLEPRATPELVAVCEKAMARDQADRYPDMTEMARDIRAYLEDRVVQAYATGPIVELRKWIRRNRPTAASLAGLLVVALLGGYLFAWQENRRAAETRRSLDSRVAAELLDERWAALGEIHPDHVGRRQAWLTELEGLENRAPEYRRTLAELRRRAARSVPDTDSMLVAELQRCEEILLAQWQEDLDRCRQVLADPGADAAARERAKEEIELHDWHLRRRDRLRRRIEAGTAHVFDTEEDQELHDALAAFVRDLDELTHPVDGLRTAVQWEVEQARGLRQRTLEEPAAAWRQVAKDLEADSRFRIADLPPQLGLVPLQKDPVSRLWEFWHVLSGARPERSADGGDWEIGPDTGMVFVLLPGEKDCMSPFPGSTVDLAPFFVSKYEVTQAQYARLTGENPSYYYAGSSWKNVGRIWWNHPVESVTWNECAALLERYGLTFPTETQFAYALRAGTRSTHWWDEVDGVEDGDLVFFRGGSVRPHAPVDAGRPNPFGLYHVSGNVWEMCRDWYAARSEDCEGFQLRTGEVLSKAQRTRATRGGGWDTTREYLHYATRSFVLPDERRESYGVRAVRPLLAKS